MNKRISRLAALLSALTLSGAGCAEAPPRAGEAARGVWQHHRASFSYFGITTAFSCAALQTDVRQLLEFFGARPGASVRATGCAPTEDAPTYNALLEAEFDTLAPSADGSAPNAVRASWIELDLTPLRPAFMDPGDCELLEQLHALIVQNFSLRDLSYRTQCLAHEVTVSDFAVKARALKALR